MGWTPEDPMNLGIDRDNPYGHLTAAALAPPEEQRQLTIKINLLPKISANFKLNVKCRHCGYSECLPSDHFCSMCGKLLVKEMICENCGSVLNRSKKNFCNYCGKSTAT